MRIIIRPLGFLIAIALVVAGCGSSSDSGTIDNGGSTPGAVTGFVATPGDSQITLTWDAQEGATGYEVYWIDETAAPSTGREAECPGNLIEGIAGPGYIHTGLTNGMGYAYGVTALNGEGNESPCPEMTDYITPTNSPNPNPKPTPNSTPTAGVCGAAHGTTYRDTDTSYGADAICAAGSASPANPAFPAQGGTSNWSCLGVNGGADAVCSATRNSPIPVNGTCGTADGKTYLDTETTYGADTFCATGTVSPASPAFPAWGGTTNWDCLGVSGGSSAACSASRNFDTDPPITLVGLALWARSPTTLTGSATINEAGTGYCTALTTTSPAPTAAEVKANSNGNKVGAGGSVAMAANTAAYCTVTGLTANTTYDVYFVAEDLSVNQQADGAVSGMTATTLGSATVTTQLVHGVSTDQVEWLVVKADTNGTGYCAAVPQGNAMPTVEDIAAAAGGAIVGTEGTVGTVALTANTSGFCTVTGLTASTAYDLYFAVKDAGDTFQATAGSVLNKSTTVAQGAAPGGMVAVLGGCYMMGDTFAEGAADERPVHPVCLSSFFMDATEVTQAAYGVNPNGYGFTGATLPAEKLNWAESSAHCTGLGKRLPTEAEWEYAARNRGVKVRYGTGTDAITCTDANYFGCVLATQVVARPGFSTANALGLFDMSGNVFEWVSDWYDGAYYASSPVTDPENMVAGTNRVARGGSWFTTVDFLRASGRGNSYPTLRSSRVGFRCASN